MKPMDNEEIDGAMGGASYGSGSNGGSNGSGSDGCCERKIKEQ